MVNALAYLTVPALIGPVVGPPLGGFITTYFHWRWIFWINVPIGVLGIAAVATFIENIRERDVARFDFKGFLLSGLGTAEPDVRPDDRRPRHRARSASSRRWSSAAPSCWSLYVVPRPARLRRDHRPVALEDRRRSSPAWSAGSLFRIGIGAIPFLLPLLLQIGFGIDAVRDRAR